LTKTLLVLGAGVQSVEGLRQLREQGWYIVGCDMDPVAPGLIWCDDTITASVYHADQCVPAVEQYHNDVRPIDGVMCLAVDAPHVVARVAAALGLPGLPIEIADLSVDKVAMKACFKAYGVPTPDFRKITSYSDLRAFAENRRDGIVVKPTDSRGSKGVLWVRELDTLGHAYEYALDWSPSNQVMVEEFTPGPQLSTESVVVGGVAHTIGISDRNYEFLEAYAPHIVENGGDLPSALSREVIDDTCNVIQQVVNAFGMDSGVIKGDIVIHEGRAKVIEVALRLSGGFFCTYEIPLNTGISTVIPTAKLALGLPVSDEELTPKFQRPVLQRYVFPKTGIVDTINGVEDALAVPNVAYAEVWVRPGRRIAKPENAGGAAGVIMTCADTYDEAMAAMHEAMDKIEVKMVPDDG
jgi:biotin carboxylase